MKTGSAVGLTPFHPAAVTLSLLIGILLVNGPVLSRGQEAPEGVKIDTNSYQAFGSGCSPEDTAVAYSEDKSTVTVIFSNLTAFMPGKESDRQKFCNLVFSVSFPDGYSYSIGRVTSRGYARIDKGANGTHRVTSRIAGTRALGEIVYVIDYPYDNNYEFTREFETRIVSACGDKRHLNIESMVSVSGPADKTAIITADTLDHSFKVELPFEWMKC